MGDDVLGVGEVFHERFQSVAYFSRGFFGGKSKGLEKFFIFNEEMVRGTANPKT